MNVLKSFQSFPSMGGHGALCFSLSGDSLKLAHGRVTSGGMKITDAMSADVQGLSDEAVAAMIRRWLDENKLGSPDVVSVIPAHSAITKDIEVPSRDDVEIREILDLQAVRHAPYSLEEIIFDYVKIGVHKDSYTRLIFIILPLSVIRKQIAVLARAGLKIEQVRYAPEAMGRVCGQIVPGRKDISRTFIHVDGKFTDFLNVAHGRLLYVRSIPIGSQHLAAERERYREKFLEEIKKSVEAYLSEDPAWMCEEYVLTGDPQELEFLQGALKPQLTKPVNVWPYWDALPLGAEKLKTDFSKAKESFLDISSTLMSLNHLAVDLLPQEIRLRKAIERKSGDLIRLGISIMAALVLGGAYLGGQIYVKNLYLNNIENTYRPALKKARELQKDFDRMKAVKEFSAHTGLPLEALAGIYEVTPLDLRLTGVKYASDGKFSMEGNARTMATVFAFIGDLEKSPMYKKVEAKRTSKRLEADEELVDFEIVCLLEPLSREGKK